MDWQGKRSLKWLALVAVAGVAWLAFPQLRGLAWIHFRTSPPERHVLPLPGLQISELEPNFGAPRTLGPHEGIDLVAPAGTPVLAVADGIIIDNRPSRIGGVALWVQGSGRRLYYYAHMKDLAPGMRRGTAVRAGERIGSVGNSGNGVDTPPHLHFAIYRVTSDLLPLRYRAMNPYPVLVSSGQTVEAEAGVPIARRSEPPTDLAPPLDPDASRSLTPDEIAAGALAAATRLASVLRSMDPFLGVEADGDIRRVPRVYGLAGAVGGLAADLTARAASDLGRPLSELPAALVERGRDLHRIRLRLESLLAWYERCAPRERSVFLSALEGLALDSVRDPAAGESSGRSADYFFFAGRPPDLVPAGGGWLVVAGRGLWSSGTPEVRLAGANAEPIERLEPHRLTDSRVAVYLTSDVLAGQRGRCLSLRIETAHPPETRGAAPLAVPLCVPVSYQSGYRMVSYLSYRLPTATRTLETDEILFSNSSCDERKEVSRTLEWPLDRDGRLVDTGEFELYSVHESSVECAIDENRVTCSGWLAPARCETEGRIDTEWHHIFSPTEEYPDRELHRSGSLAPFVAAGPAITRTCVEIHRGEPSDETSIWFDLFVQNADQQERFFSSPHEVAAGPVVSRYEQGPHQIEAELDPATEPELASVCVTVRSPECTSLGTQ
jgi:hypothetical protein